jgi:hypothetical protein
MPITDQELWRDAKKQYVGQDGDYSVFIVEPRDLLQMVGYVMEDIKSGLGFTLDELAEMHVTRRTGPYQASRNRFEDGEAFYEIRVRPTAKTTAIRPGDKVTWAGEGGTERIAIDTSKAPPLVVETYRGGEEPATLEEGVRVYGVEEANRLFRFEIE